MGEVNADFSLRRAGPADIEAILPLVVMLHDSEGDAPPGGARAALAPLLANPDWGAVWAIEAEGNVIGYAAVAFGYSIVFGGRDGFLDEICLAPGWRRRGIGSRTVRAIMAEMKREGLKALHLEAHRDKTAVVALYRGLGFEFRARYHLMSAML